MNAEPPVSFDKIAGQERAVAFLRKAVRTGHAAHAYLLIGPEGVGRVALARAVCKALMCSRPVDGEWCGECEHCRLFDRGTHPDHAEFRLDTTERQEFPIEIVREQIIEQSTHRPVKARRRTFIVEDIDRFSVAAANCFLKTLEEPPGGTVFILIAGSTQRIPETILSRCQLVRLKPVPTETIREMLLADGCGEEEAAWLARFSFGSPGRAVAARRLSLFNFYAELSGALGSITLADNFDLSRMLYDMTEGSDSARERRLVLVQLLEGVLFYYREQLAAAADASEDANDFSKFLEISDIIMEAIAAIESNANQTLALDAMWTRITLMESCA